MKMAVKYHKEAFRVINAALSEEDIENLSPPISCAAVLAQKLNLSDMHQAMAAGLAGGIGLSGGGCGALGAAIWVNGMNKLREGAANKVINMEASEMISKFLKDTDFKLECSAIVGRKFKDVADHADYLHSGGCSEIIEQLAAL
jgi:hypothetical protein